MRLTVTFPARRGAERHDERRAPRERRVEARRLGRRAAHFAVGVVLCDDAAAATRHAARRGNRGGGAASRGFSPDDGAVKLDGAVRTALGEVVV